MQTTRLLDSAWPHGVPRAGIGRLMPHAALSVATVLAALLPGDAIAQRAGSAQPEAAASSVAASSPAAACAALVSIPDIPGTLVAAYHPGGTAHAGGKPSGASLAAHCLVRGELAPHVGVGDRKFHTGIELRLPDDWNGRFLYVGGGGNDGVVREAIGDAASGLGDSPALNRGYAVVTTDAGHQGPSADFALDALARVEHAYVAHDRTARAAKSLISQRYGRAPQRSYFYGCSGGGRQGMMFTQRFPDYFDGVIAMAPAMRVSSGATIAAAWNARAFHDAAPADPATGKRLTHEALSDDNLNLVAKAILERCDAGDGLADGMVGNPKACRFDPTVLTCGNGKTAQCLENRQVAALRAYLDGPKDAAGRALYFPQAPDPAIASEGWRLWALGDAKRPSRYVFLMQDALRYEFLTPPDPGFDMLRFDFDADPARMEAFSWTYDTYKDTRLDRFRKHGGKLLMLHGMADPIFSPAESVDYIERIAGDAGGAEEAASFARLFLVPGVNHCRGGIGTEDFDALSALVEWVEQGKAPDRILARSSPSNRVHPDRSRPLCAWPSYPKYDGRGDHESAESFACTTDR